MKLNSILVESVKLLALSIYSVLQYTLDSLLAVHLSSLYSLKRSIAINTTFPTNQPFKAPQHKKSHHSVILRNKTNPRRYPHLAHPSSPPLASPQGFTSLRVPTHISFRIINENHETDAPQSKDNTADEGKKALHSAKIACMSLYHLIGRFHPPDLSDERTAKQNTHLPP